MTTAAPRPASDIAVARPIPLPAAHRQATQGGRGRDDGQPGRLGLELHGFFEPPITVAL
jgi:hypothetical protein